MSDCLIFKEKKALFHLKQSLMCYLKILFSENMGGVKKWFNWFDNGEIFYIICNGQF